MSKVTVNPIGTLIDSTTAQTAINANFQTVATAFDNTLSLDGTTPNTMQANLNMNSKQIVNLPAPATPQSPLRLQDATSITNTGTIVLLPTGGTIGQGLEKKTNADYDVQWGNKVSSIGLALPTDFTVTGSPVTSTGTLTGAWAVTPTGTGAVVRATNPALVTPNLGTPSAVVLTNGTGLPIATGVTGLGTGVASAAATAVSTGGGMVLFNGPLGTPSSGTLTSATGLPITTGVSGLAAGASTFLATPSSANLRTLMTDETGTGVLVFAGGALGAATATTINGSTVSPGHYSGEPSTGNPLAGEIGEYITAQILSGAAISLTSGTAANIASISLTAGDWDITGGVQFVNGATTSTTFQGVWISTTSATFSALADDGYVSYNGGAFVNYNAAYATGVKRLQLSSTTTVFISVLSNFTVSTCTAYGKIRARRAR